MFSTSIWVLISWAVAILVLWSFVWKRMGLGKGRAYGNKLAAHLGWQKNFFHSVLDNGVNGPSLMLLNSIEQMGVPHHLATVMLAPSLARGLNALDARFAPQAMIEDAKPIVKSLLEEWEAQPGNQEQVMS